MKDACWFEIKFRRVDLQKLNEILANHIDDEGKWWDEDLGDDPDSVMMKVSVSEANGAWADECSALVDGGLSFTAEHGGGDEYGPCVFASYEGDFVECKADFNGNPCCTVLREGISQAHILQCRKYWELVQKIEEASENN